MYGETEEEALQEAYKEFGAKTEAERKRIPARSLTNRRACWRRQARAPRHGDPTRHARVAQL